MRGASPKCGNKTHSLTGSRTNIRCRFNGAGASSCPWPTHFHPPMHFRTPNGMRPNQMNSFCQSRTGQKPRNACQQSYTRVMHGHSGQSYPAQTAKPHPPTRTRSGRQAGRLARAETHLPEWQATGGQAEELTCSSWERSSVELMTLGTCSLTRIMRSLNSWSKVPSFRSSSCTFVSPLRHSPLSHARKHFCIVHVCASMYIRMGRPLMFSSECKSDECMCTRGEIKEMQKGGHQHASTDNAKKEKWRTGRSPK